MRKIAVFDTNILFSGVAWKGKPFLCLELARAGLVDGVTCHELLDELAEKLESKLSFTPEQTLDTVADLLTFLRVVPITGKLDVIPADADDDEEDQIHQVPRPRVEPPRPREGIGVELLGELLGFRDRKHRGRPDPGKEQEVVSGETLGLPHERVSAPDVDVELRIRLARRAPPRMGIAPRPSGRWWAPASVRQSGS